MSLDRFGDCMNTSEKHDRAAVEYQEMAHRAARAGRESDFHTLIERSRRHERLAVFYYGKAWGIPQP